MQYLIDTADPNEIEEVMAYGIDGITANTTMYRRQGIGVRSFVARWAERKPSFLSGEVIGSFEQMEEQAKELLAIDPDIVIKINFSKEGLRLAHRLHQQGVRTAMTLLFTVTQAVAAMQAGCDYLFFFIGRNEEQGWDGMEAIAQLQALVDACRAEGGRRLDQESLSAGTAGPSSHRLCSDSLCALYAFAAASADRERRKDVYRGLRTKRTE